MSDSNEAENNIYKLLNIISDIYRELNKLHEQATNQRLFESIDYDGLQNKLSDLYIKTQTTKNTALKKNMQEPVLFAMLESLAGCIYILGGIVQGLGDKAYSRKKYPMKTYYNEQKQYNAAYQELLLNYVQVAKYLQ